MGGPQRFEEKLDSMFEQGLYWHGNEPCHQIAYLYNYVGRNDKTRRWVRHILDTEYNDTPGGLSGNDDAGQMSAWYIFSSLGFYPVCPGTPYYQLSGPTFRRATLNLENGKKFVLERKPTPSPSRREEPTPNPSRGEWGLNTLTADTAISNANQAPLPSGGVGGGFFPSGGVGDGFSISHFDILRGGTLRF